MSQPSVGCRLPLEGFTRSAQREATSPPGPRTCFQAERARLWKRKSPSEADVTSTGGPAAPARTASQVGTAAATPAGGSNRTGAPANRRNGSGWLAQSSQPSERA